MTPSRFGALLGGYFALLAVAAAVIVFTFELDPRREPTAVTIVTAWKQGERVARRVTDEDPTAVLADTVGRGAVRVFERIVDEGPLLHFSALAVAASVVPGRDGIHVSFRGRECYLTPDDLLRHQLYLVKSELLGMRVKFGVDPEALGLLADECQAESVGELLGEGTFRRFLVKRSYPDRRVVARDFGPADVSLKVLRESVEAAAEYLVRHCRRDGGFDYEIGATEYTFTSGYSWPRHAGATQFLADAARLTGKRRFGSAAVRAARHMRDHNTLRCGTHACVGSGSRTDLGSSALALLAYVEVVQAGLDDGLLSDVRALAAFLRSMQRADGEFMHLYDVAGQRAIDQQLPYYSGEAALALARAHRLTGDQADLDAAARVIAFLTRDSRAFFGSRYLYDAQHWTCQAVEDLWRRSPDPTALRFCLDWQAHNRSLQFDPTTELGPYDGGYFAVPWYPPRICAAGSRSEAGVATLVTGIHAGADPAELEALEDQLRRSFAYLLRHQFSPGPFHLMKRPRQMRGTFPGSPFEYNSRIDLPQHVGSAMIRYIRLLQQRERGEVTPP